ncbi:MAG: DUF2085 domain-containing protein [Chloroflexota bacterium]
MLTITLFSRADCRLCEQAKQDLVALQDQYPHRLTVVDIDNDSDLLKTYGFDIPVVKVGPYTLNAPFDRPKLAMTLGAAQDGKQHLEKIDAEHKKQTLSGRDIPKGERFSYWISRHYLLVFNLFVFLYVGLPFLAPVLMKVDATTPAIAIYRVYSGLCHQLAFRSWFLFGEQPVYPRESAGLEGYLTFHEATGLDEQGLIAARSFIGTDSIGYKVALCQRDVAIYGAILFFGLLFGLTGRRIKPLPIWLWLLIGLVPVGLDGVSQLISQIIADPLLDFLQPYLGFLTYRESTPVLRTLTGFLFGFATAWFGYPLVEETMVDARQLLTARVVKREA